MTEGVGKEFYRKGNSLTRFRPLSESLDSKKFGIFCAHPLPQSLTAPKSHRLLRFAIAMPIADPRNRAISETRDSNDALRFKGAIESR